MSKILLSQDDALCTRILGDLTKFKRTFSAVKSAFEQLQIGTLTNDIFNFIIEGNANGLRPVYIKSVEDQLTAQGVNNPVLRTIAMDGTHELFNQFAAAVKDFINTDLTPSQYGLDKDRTAFLSLTDLSQSNGDLVIRDEARERILEQYCRIYAATDQEQAIYNAALSLADSLSTFMKVAKNAGLTYNKQEFMNGREGYMVNSYLENFFFCDANMNFEVRPESVPWAAGYKASVERMQRFYNR